MYLVATFVCCIACIYTRYLATNDQSCECRWHRFQSTTCTLLLSMPSLRCSVSSLSQQSDALVPSVPDTIYRSYARISRRYLSIIHPYRFSDRLVSIPNRAIHLVPLATLTDTCYRKRAMSSSLAFPPLYCLLIPFFGRAWFFFVRLMMMWS